MRDGPCLNRFVGWLTGQMIAIFRQAAISCHLIFEKWRTSRLSEPENEDGRKTRLHDRFIRRRLPSIAVFAIPARLASQGWPEQPRLRAKQGCLSAIAPDERSALSGRSLRGEDGCRNEGIITQ